MIALLLWPRISHPSLSPPVPRTAHPAVASLLWSPGPRPSPVFRSAICDCLSLNVSSIASPHLPPCRCAAGSTRRPATWPCSRCAAGPRWAARGQCGSPEGTARGAACAEVRAAARGVGAGAAAGDAGGPGGDGAVRLARPGDHARALCAPPLPSR